MGNDKPSATKPDPLLLEAQALRDRLVDAKKQQQEENPWGHLPPASFGVVIELSELLVKVLERHGQT